MLTLSGPHGFGELSSPIARPDLANNAFSDQFRHQQAGHQVVVGLHRFDSHAMPLTYIVFAFIKSLGVRDAILRLSWDQ
jgi:hypothetical protein